MAPPPIFNNSTQANNVYPVANATTSTNTFVDFFSTRDPTVNDTNFQTQKKWLNTTTERLWILQNFTSASNQIKANWILIGSSSLVETLTGNSGGAVAPDAFSNINVVGDGTTVLTVGNPATNTLTISAGGSLATTYTEDAGSAAPAGGILNILGGFGISTVGAGNTVTINSSGTVATSYVEDAGSAIPAGNILNIIGGAGITTSGAGNTVTITATNPTPEVLTVNPQTFLASGIYTPSVNMQYCIIECLAGGAGGGGGAGGVGISGSSAASGGAGGYARGVFSAATIGASKPVTIGAGGAGGAAGNNPGAAGGTSSVGALISATGGSGGNGSPFFTLPIGAIQRIAIGGVGGTGIGGDFQTVGNAGGDSFLIAVPGSGNMVYNYAGGSSFFGGAGTANMTTGGNSNGLNATSFGGGGSGGVAIGIPSGGVSGGNGFQGLIYITEFILS